MFPTGWKIFFLALLTLSACTPGETETIPSQPIAAKTLDLPSPMPSQTPTQTLTPTKTPTGTPTLEPPFRMCSPLQLHPLEELPGIVGDPYNPPPPGKEERHHGVDFAYYHWKDRDSMLGEPVQSILPGMVASSIEDHYPYGNMVIVETPRSVLPADLVEKLKIPEGQSLYLLYAHLDQAPLVELGDAVEACQPIGVVGMSGNTDIPHLHLETRLGPAGSVFESMRFYDTHATIEEMETYKLWRTSGVYQHFDPMRLLSTEDRP